MVSLNKRVGRGNPSHDRNVKHRIILQLTYIQESILNWYEEDENFTEQQAEQIYSAVYNKLKYGGWKAAKEELESHNLDGIASYIEASYRLCV